MKSLTLLAILLFFIFSLGLVAYNAWQVNQAKAQGFIPVILEVKPPYYFTPGEFLSEFNSFFFVFVFSLLFFGLGAMIALAVEGLKYGSMLSNFILRVPSAPLTTFQFYDLLFIIPQMVAVIGATTLGSGLVLDFRGRASVFPYWNSAVKYFAVGVALVALLAFARPFVVH